MGTVGLLLGPVDIVGPAFDCILAVLPVVDYIRAGAEAACVVHLAFDPFAPAEEHSPVR